MASIMCAQPLWRALRDTGLRSSSRDEPIFQGVALAQWAATTARFDRHRLVVAVDAATCLTVVFRLEPCRWFRRRFADAVRNVLADLHVPEPTALLESTVIDVMPIRPLDDKSLSSILKDVQFFCELEVEYHTDLRIVQRNLNDAPIRNPLAGSAAEAVQLFFGQSAAPAQTH